MAADRGNLVCGWPIRGYTDSLHDAFHRHAPRLDAIVCSNAAGLAASDGLYAGGVAFGRAASADAMEYEFLLADSYFCLPGYMLPRERVEHRTREVAQPLDAGLQRGSILPFVVDQIREQPACIFRPLFVDSGGRLRYRVAREAGAQGNGSGATE